MGTNHIVRLIVGVPILVSVTGCAILPVKTSNVGHRAVEQGDGPAASSNETADVPSVQKNGALNRTEIPTDVKAQIEASQVQVDKDPWKNLKLCPLFVLNITVKASGVIEFREKNKRVGYEGTMELPLIGTVKAAGMTLDDFSEHLTDLFKKYLRTPQVAVEFVKAPASIAPWGYVTVLGRVGKPGRVNVPPSGEMPVSAAISNAGGLAKHARETGVIVIRKNTSGASLERFKVNLHSSVTLGEKADMKLRAGDVLYVPVRIF